MVLFNERYIFELVNVNTRWYIAFALDEVSAVGSCYYGRFTHLFSSLAYSSI